MQTVDFIGVMFEELQMEYRKYLRLRDELERTHAEKELARNRVELLQKAIGNEQKTLCSE